MRWIDSASTVRPAALLSWALRAATRACWLNCEVAFSVPIITSALLTICAAALNCDCSLSASCCTENATPAADKALWLVVRDRSRVSSANGSLVICGTAEALRRRGNHSASKARGRQI
ncbi:hypothetical protein D3C81_1790860 [compost metagenome]